MQPDAAYVHSRSSLRELRNIEKCNYLVESYKKSLSIDTTLPEDVSIRLNNFANYFHRLIKNKIKEDNISLNILKNEIQNTETVEYKKWLIDQIDEMI